MSDIIQKTSLRMHCKSLFCFGRLYSKQLLGMLFSYDVVFEIFCSNTDPFSIAGLRFIVGDFIQTNYCWCCSLKDVFLFRSLVLLQGFVLL